MLAQYLDPRKIFLNFEEHDYEQALRTLVMVSNEKNIDVVLKNLQEREKVMTTAMGRGILMPRATIEGKERSEVIMAVNHSGFVLQDHSALAVNIIMLFLFSDKDDRPTMLAQALRLINDENLRKTIFRCKRPEDVITAIAEWEKA